MSRLSRVAGRAAQLAPQRSDWAQVRLRADLTAGLMVALVALPLALGFGASSGLGPAAGLVTAIVAGAVAAVFGGSRVQVSGPTGAMTVVLVPIVAEHGPDAVLVVGLLAGLVLVGLGWSGAGRFIRYVPVPVVEGFTVGIAAIIALQQMPAALGVEVHAEKVTTLAAEAVSAFILDPQWTPVTIATGVAVLTFTLGRLLPWLPGSLIAVAVATVANMAAHTPAATIGALPSTLPAPALPSIDPGTVQSLLLPAIAVAALAALESLLSATVADGMSVGRRHDSDRELVGQGLANIVTPLFGGIPATAAIARTAVNIRSGATSRLAALTHAVALLLIVLVAATAVSQIPTAALAGVLIATAIQMVKVSSLFALLRATRGDAVVLCITAIATVLLDLVTAVLIGMIVAGFFALRQAARTARVEPTPLDSSDHTDEERQLLHDHIVAYRIDGPLFFAAAHDFLLELADVTRVQVVILRLSHVTIIDATGAHMLVDTLRRLEGRHITVLLSGVQPRHLHVLRQLGVFDHVAHERHLFATTPEAIEHGRTHVAQAGRMSPSGSGAVHGSAGADPPTTEPAPGC